MQTGIGHAMAESLVSAAPMLISVRHEAESVLLVVVIGALMYVVEGEANGFTSIPRSIYWAIVTLTTVGYGDVSPRTTVGQIPASIVMVIGYGIIAVPTGIVTVELAQAGRRKQVSGQSCPSCSAEGHDPDAVYCKYCGTRL